MLSDPKTRNWADEHFEDDTSTHAQPAGMFYNFHALPRGSERLDGPRLFVEGKDGCRRSSDCRLFDKASCFHKYALPIN